MKKENILRKNWEFQDVIKKNNQIINRYLVIYYVSNNHKKLKVGISISKKFINAVKRNYFRRRVRSSLDIINFFEKPFDVVLILRKPFLLTTFEEQTEIIKKSLGKLPNGTK